MEKTLDLRDGARGSEHTDVFTEQDGDFHFLGEYFDGCTFDCVVAPEDLKRYMTHFAVYHWLHILKSGGRLVLDSPSDKLIKQLDKAIPFCECYRHGHLFIAEKLPVHEKRRIYRHSGARGDLIYSLPCIETMGGGDLNISLSSVAYNSTPMTHKDVSQLSEILERLPFIDSVKSFELGDRIDWNLNRFRKTCCDYTHLALCHLITAGVNTNLSNPWIDKSLFDVRAVAPIVIARSQRYHAYFDWDALTRWQNDCVFIGSKTEYDEFKSDTGLDVAWYGESTMLELVEVIAGCKLFVGNQSFPYSIAEAMKVPRVLEVYIDALNSLPHGIGGYTRLTEGLIESILNGDTPEGTGRKYRMTFNENRGRSRSVAIMLSGIKRSIEVCCLACGEFASDAKFAESFGVKVVESEEQITGDYICVIDCSERVSSASASLVERIINTVTRVKREGLFGEMDIKDGKPEWVGMAYGVSRRAYEECGLRRKGESRTDMTKRYGEAGYRFYSIGGAR